MSLLFENPATPFHDFGFDVIEGGRKRGNGFNSATGVDVNSQCFAWPVLHLEGNELATVTHPMEG
jgi:hypothetical protein